MKKIMISVLSIIVLSFLLCNIFAEAKTRTGGTKGTGSSYTKPSTSSPTTSPSKQSSGSTTNTVTKSPSYSSLTTKYPKSTRYFSGNVLSQTLLFGSILLLLNETNDDEPTYVDEEGNVYTLADLEEMDVQIPDEESSAEDLYSETVVFDEKETAVPEVIETASSYENPEDIDNGTYTEDENAPFNWLWLILPLAVVVIALSFLRKKHVKRN